MNTYREILGWEPGARIIGGAIAPPPPSPTSYFTDLAWSQDNNTLLQQDSLPIHYMFGKGSYQAKNIRPQKNPKTLLTGS